MDQEPNSTRPFGWSQRLNGGLPVQPPLPSSGERLKLNDRISIDDVSYKIERLLGEGASGRVFAASRVGTNTLVAIKEVAFERISSSPVEAVEKISGEIQALQALGPLKLPGLPAPGGFEVDVSNDRALIVTELIEGTPLDEQRATKGPLSESDIDDLIVILGGALATLHRPPLLAWRHLPLDGNALVHGDIKPGNILATPNPDRPFVLVDFGTAAPTTHARHSTVYERIQRAQTTDVPEGTYPYADPHFAMTRRHLPVSDVYSFAATILELASPQSIQDYLAAQKLPLEATLDPRQGPLLQHLAKQLQLSPKLKQVLESSLSLNPAERPQDLREFLHELGEKRLNYWHRDRDGLIVVDLERSKTFPPELQIAIQSYITLIEEVLTDPNSTVNCPLKTVPIFIQGAARDTIDSDALKLWERQITLLRERRQPLLEYWKYQAETKGRSGLAISEFLTYTDALLTRQLGRRPQEYYFHPTVTPEELDRIGLTLLPERRLFLESPLAHTLDEEIRTFRLETSGVQRSLKPFLLPAERAYRVYLSTGRVLTMPTGVARTVTRLSARAWTYLGQEKREVQEVIRTLRVLQADPEFRDPAEEKESVINADTVWRSVMTTVSSGNWGRAFALLDTHRSLSELHSDHDQLLIKYLNHQVRTRGYQEAIRSLQKRPALTPDGKEQIAKLHDDYLLELAAKEVSQIGYDHAIQTLRRERGMMMTSEGKAQVAMRHDDYVLTLAERKVSQVGYNFAIKYLREELSRMMTPEGKELVAKRHDHYLLKLADWLVSSRGYRAAIQTLREEYSKLMTAGGKQSADALLKELEYRQSNR